MNNKSLLRYLKIIYQKSIKNNNISASVKAIMAMIQYMKYGPIPKEDWDLSPSEIRNRIKKLQSLAKKQPFYPFSAKEKEPR